MIQWGQSNTYDALALWLVENDSEAEFEADALVDSRVVNGPRFEATGSRSRLRCTSIGALAGVRN